MLSAGRVASRLGASLRLKLGCLLVIAGAAIGAAYHQAVRLDLETERRHHWEGRERATAILRVLASLLLPLDPGNQMTVSAATYEGEGEDLQLVFIPNRRPEDSRTSQDAAALPLGPDRVFDEAYRRKLLAIGQETCSLHNSALPAGHGEERMAAVGLFTVPSGCWTLVSAPIASDGEAAERLANVKIYCLVAALGAIAISMSVVVSLRAHARLAYGLWQRRAPILVPTLACPVTELEADVAFLNHSLIELHQLCGVIRQASEDDSHDLKTPLALIKVAHKRVRRACAGNEGAKGLAALDAADQAIDRMLAMIDAAQLLAEETTELAIAPRINIALIAVVDRCRRSLAPLTERKNLQVIVHRSMDAAVSANPRLVEGLLGDVLRNAVEASTEGGEISIALGFENGEQKITVCDGGACIDPSYAGLMFVREPLATYTTEPPSHAPRRYYIAKRNADLLGGEFSIRNGLAGGVEAVVRFPACLTVPITKIARGDH